MNVVVPAAVDDEDEDDEHATIIEPTTSVATRPRKALILQNVALFVSQSSGPPCLLSRTRRPARATNKEIEP